MYLRLYDSLVAWYSQWYPHGFYRYFVAALALTVLMALNILSIVSVLGILGFRSPMDRLADNRSAALSLFGALTCVHLALAVWRSPSNPQHRDGSSPSGSKRVALYYMVLSAVAFFASFMVLVLSRPRG
jgi:hypothetical protein